MVGLCPACVDEFVSHGLGEGKIGQPVTVQVAQLDFAQPEFNAPESVWSRRHPLPAKDFIADRCIDLTHRGANPAGGPLISPRRRADWHFSRDGDEKPDFWEEWPDEKGF